MRALVEYPRTKSVARSIEGDVKQEGEKREKFGDGSEHVIAALVEVHRTLGPGLLESAYEACFCRELHLRGLRFERQRPLPVEYKGLLVDCGYRLDVVVEDRILVELKAVERLLPIRQAHVVTYLKLSRLGSCRDSTSGCW